MRDLLPFLRDDDISIIDNTSNSSYEYWGYASPGSQTSESEWKIIKWTKDGNGLFIMKQFANGSPAYASIWDLRTSYAYS